MTLEIVFVVKRKVFGIVELKPIEVKLQINYCYIYFQFLYFPNSLKDTLHLHALSTIAKFIGSLS